MLIPSVLGSASVYDISTPFQLAGKVPEMQQQGHYQLLRVTYDDGHLTVYCYEVDNTCICFVRVATVNGLIQVGTALKPLTTVFTKNLGCIIIQIQVILS